MRAAMKKDKIQEALELLNEAAQQKKDDIYVLLGDKYEHLRDFFESAVENGETVAGQAKKKIVKGLHQEEKKIKEAVSSIDKKVRKQPWPVLGGVALGALVIGLVLGKK